MDVCEHCCEGAEAGLSFVWDGGRRAWQASQVQASLLRAEDPAHPEQSVSLRLGTPAGHAGWAASRADAEPNHASVSRCALGLGARERVFWQRTEPRRHGLFLPL